MDEETEEEVLEPEVLPPTAVQKTDEAPQEPEEHAPSTAQRVERAFGPILAGAMIDFMDLASHGIFGLFIGAAAGFYISSVFGLPARTRMLWAIAAGWYCLLPFTRFLPIATLIGAYVRFRDSAGPAR